MPFSSKKQRRYLWANEPEIAEKWTEELKAERMRGFDSLKQAYHLHKNKLDVFNQISWAWGLPKGWHVYKKNRDKGESDIEAQNSYEFLAAAGFKEVWRDTKKWQDVLKVFYSDDDINKMYNELEQECMDWAALEKVNMGDWGHIDSIKGRLWQMQMAINNEKMDLLEQFTELYKLTDYDYDIQRMGDELYEALKWREDNE